MENDWKIFLFELVFQLQSDNIDRYKQSLSYIRNILVLYHTYQDFSGDKKMRFFINIVKITMFFSVGLGLLFIPYERFKVWFPQAPGVVVMKGAGIVSLLCGIIILALVQSGKWFSDCETQEQMDIVCLEYKKNVLLKA